MIEAYATLIGIGVQTLLYLVGAYTLVVRNDTRMEALRTQMTDVTQELKKLSEVVTIQAVQTIRLDNLTALVATCQRQIEDLRRGDGYITRPKSLG